VQGAEQADVLQAPLSSASCCHRLLPLAVPAAAAAAAAAVAVAVVVSAPVVDLACG